MDVMIIPFHDWRKSEKEGFRTRDVHFIKALANDKFSNRILVINRPITILELFYKGFKKHLKGNVVLKSGRFTLTEVDTNIFVADYHSKDILGQAMYRFKWFIEAYNNNSYKEFIEDCKRHLNFESSSLITQNIFAYKLAASLTSDKKLFDAWDNFLKFPGYASLKQDLQKGYAIMAKEISNWITNSNENIAFYKENFKVEHIDLLKNGVKENFAIGLVSIPDDLKSIKKPWIGFGGKISYLMDSDLINYITADNPLHSFVFVGQILDKKVYNKIIKRSNVHFLGDKKYSHYANYVKSFDICIVPYNIKTKQHGGDSMKAYEYLLAGKKVVGTNGNGLEDLKDYIYVEESKENFSVQLKTFTNEKLELPLEEHSWLSKAQTLLCILKN